MPVDPEAAQTITDPHTCDAKCHLAADGISFVLDPDCVVHG